MDRICGLVGKRFIAGAGRSAATAEKHGYRSCWRCSTPPPAYQESRAALLARLGIAAGPARCRCHAGASSPNADLLRQPLPWALTGVRGLGAITPSRVRSFAAVCSRSPRWRGAALAARPAARRARPGAAGCDCSAAPASEITSSNGLCIGEARRRGNPGAPCAVTEVFYPPHRAHKTKTSDARPPGDACHIAYPPIALQTSRCEARRGAPAPRKRAAAEADAANADPRILRAIAADEPAHAITIGITAGDGKCHERTGSILRSARARTVAIGMQPARDRRAGCP